MKHFAVPYIAVTLLQLLTQSDSVYATTVLFDNGQSSAIQLNFRNTAGGNPLLASDISVLQTVPASSAVSAPTDSVLTIQFDRVVDTTTVTTDTLRVFGRWSGATAGTIAFADSDTTALFTPDNPFSAGESVMVVMSNQIGAIDGTALTGGYSWQFWTRTAPNSFDYQEIERHTTRSDPLQSSRAYGGVATDLNRDGWLDISIINEDTADVRVFLNTADGSGLFQPFLEPPTAVNDRASPSEPADFDNDGNSDLAVANINTNSVSILLGNGDGTFAPQQEIAVGGAPRGIAVLDADGDGDIDVVNTNAAGAGSLSLLINDGNGVFGAPTFFDGGGDGEWSLGAADMNNDGRLDLVVSAWIGNTQKMVVLLNNGNGTFSGAGSQPVADQPWMLNLADVNLDGNEDVVVVNSFADHGTVIMGDGAGNLTVPVTYPTDPFALATDLGDIDGDGDLDWVTSSYSGDWFLYLNQGDGSFVFDREFGATIAASCALMLDINNDNILDLALIDEEADEVIIMRHGRDTDGDDVFDALDNCINHANADQRDTNADGFGNICDGDLNNDCIVNSVDLGLLRAVFFSSDEDADFNGDGGVNAIDLGIFRSLFFAPPGPSGVTDSCSVAR